MTDSPRLIEFAFPLKQTSLDSVHEKNVRHGHISTLHIWPAAAARGVPGGIDRHAAARSGRGRQKEISAGRELCEKIGGKVVKRIEKKKMPGGQVVERDKMETQGGILHWLEQEPPGNRRRNATSGEERALGRDSSMVPAGDSQRP